MIEARSERGHPVRLSEQRERTHNVEVLGEIFINGYPYDLSPDTGIYIRPHETFAIEIERSDAATFSIADYVESCSGSWLNNRADNPSFEERTMTSHGRNS